MGNTVIEFCPRKGLREREHISFQVVLRLLEFQRFNQLRSLNELC